MTVAPERPETEIDGDGPAPPGFTLVAERLATLLGEIAASDPAAGEVLRQLPIDLSLDLNLGPDSPRLTFEQRFDTVCELLELDALCRAVLAVCVAPELHPHYRRCLPASRAAPAWPRHERSRGFSPESS